MKKVIIAGAASVALAAMPVLGVFAEPVVDNLSVTVSPSCTFTDGGAGVSYTATGTNAAGQVDLENNNSNEHSFTVFCNNNAGYKVSATATNLAQTGVTANFAYAATLPDSGTTGAWNATFASSDVTPVQIATVNTATDIITKGSASGADGETFTATYTAYIGTATPAGTYTGTISYTLSAQ